MSPNLNMKSMLSLQNCFTVLCSVQMQDGCSYKVCFLMNLAILFMQLGPWKDNTQFIMTDISQVCSLAARRLINNLTT